MNVTFIGTGYVGLVTGTCFAKLGHNITCVDIDEQKVANLRNGIVPIYEPGLAELVEKYHALGSLHFSTDLAEAMSDSDVIFIGVGTPQRPDGSCDVRFVFAVVEEILAKATSSKIVVIKSTVPVGTNAEAQKMLNQGDIQHHVVSNPEFLREGFAVDDALHPDRVVVGLEDDSIRDTVEELFRPFTEKDVPVLYMNRESAEMTKYVANCVLATKISYINEMANMCEAVGADVNDVRAGIGHDQRIGFRFFAPGAGYGGSCFPKDVRAMKALAREKKMPMRILEAVDYVNEEQKRVPYQKLGQAFNDQIRGTKIAIWGLAFKPETDDIREAPAFVLIEKLTHTGAKVRVYDPQALDNARERLGDTVTYCEDAYLAASGADAVVIMTEWNEFKETDFDKLRSTMNGNVIIDGRNLFAPDTPAKAGFVYSSIGRATAYPGFNTPLPFDQHQHQPAATSESAR